MNVKNGIAAISSEVLGDVQKEAEATILEAENQAKETLKLAKHEADQKYREMINQAKLKAETEKRKIASTTELEIRNRLLQTKEDLVDFAFDKALTKLINYVETDEYRKHLLNQIEDVAKKIGQKNLVAEVNAKDAAWLNQEKLAPIAKKLHAEIKLSKATEQFIGGCIIQTADGKIIFNNTIDARLEELKPTLRIKVAKILFEEE
jgi:V/A-type H+-transporting ATPase subunit E